MHSRTLDFADEIMALTNGEGVDIVLNALADEFIDKSFAVLADNGRFLEMGKRGIWTHEQVTAFNPTLAYFPYDLADVARETPHLIGDMMRELTAQFESGVLRPLPQRTFPIAQAIDAFRFMSQARHVGKIVLEQQAVTAVRPDGTYLVTGGLGGLGLATARGLAQQGARHLVLLGRHAPSAAAEAELAHLRADGVTVVTAQADVAVANEVQRVLNQIAAEMPPLRGVIHAAGVLADGRLANQTWEQFAKVMAPKILGTHHLDRLTRELPLDFFVCFSAGSGAARFAGADQLQRGQRLHGRPGCWPVKAAGLPGLSINWGAWADVGMAAGLDARTRAQWQASGVETIPPQEGWPFCSNCWRSRRRRWRCCP
jgi:NAD(P)-dependent dehydrogenase (short-subunit alcohol dehydrogenase family)